ncbi:hypothetical protein RB620_10125 [Paenibacillus sp. LHD-117]|uniref:hypothetical protein n=1 Tax=Paenibacillus sp. LHD-117 TaxID=3071412 RepID=UPI0027DFEADC|nr:hypothetical protein [Paenibacillus sp. LHD-117]MDQ6419787.1 hypothetical protein [Paenibacillus sp. LHD-117]
MGTTAVILTKKVTYSHEKLLNDISVATNHAGINMHIDNYQHLTLEGDFSYRTLNISTDKVLSEDSSHSLLMYVHSNSNPSIDFYYYNDLDLDNELSLVQVGHIEEIFGVQHLLLDFVYEYLKVNQNDYLWITDYDWVYGCEEISKLKMMSSYDANWCYKNPKEM